LFLAAAAVMFAAKDAGQTIDAGSFGVFVNGQRVTKQVLTEQDLVSIGSSTFRLTGGELRQFVDDGNITFTAQELVVKAGNKVLLDHVTFPIPEKCLLGVIGPSGAGKSTLLGALTGMRPATTGTVLYDNRDLYQNYNELRYRIGLVPQESVLHTQLTARRALQYSAELRFPADIKPAERDGRVDEVMGELGLTRHANTRADRLSGGQTQRVRFALAICGKSELIVLDEPTAAMDVETRRLFWNSMKEEVAAGRTLLFATHYLEEADQAADRILVINRGRLLADGTPAEIKARAGARRLSFRLDKVDEPFLLGLPGLVNLEVRHDVVQIQSADSDATLYAILDAGYRPSEIEVTSLGLEQAFLAITAEDNATNGHSAGETN